MQITLANLHEATEQQVFEQVANHLIKQGVRSIEKGRCLYRSSDGKMCAAGCLMSDSEYDPEMDKIFKGGIWGVLVDNKLAPVAHKDFIRQLQILHDGHNDFSDFRKELIAFGLGNDLNVDFLNK